MSIKKLGLALVAVLALAGTIASSAFATAVTESGHEWYRNGVTVSSPVAVSCEKDPSTGNFTLNGTVLGTPVELTATGVECLESTIFNEGSGSVPYIPKDKGKLKFTGVSIMKPVGCSTTSTLTTAALNTELFREGTTIYDRFVPASGTTFVSITITGCAAAGTYPVRGTDFGLSNRATGVEALTQRLAFSGAINTTAGGALTLGTAAATLEGAALNTLTAGGNFGAK